MLGKAFYTGNWHLLRFEHNKLEIFKEICKDKPLGFYVDESTLNEDSLITAILEDGKMYVFDISNGDLKEGFSEYFLISIENINYFVSNKVDSTKFKGVNGIKKLILVNGILKPMLELSKTLAIDVNFDNIKTHIKFCVDEYKNHLLFNLGTYSKMLTSNPNIEQEYKMSLEFDSKIDLKCLNNIIEYIYKFLGFFNFDLSPYIDKMIVETEYDSFLYFKNTINYKDKYIRKWNYLNNCNTKCISNMLEKIKDIKYDISFINLLNINKITIEDVWALSKSIESIGNENDLDNRTKEEIKIYEKLKDEIKKAISIFEKENEFKIEKQKKSFILNLIEIPAFRKKTANILKKYNDFAITYNKYSKLSDTEINEYSKTLSILRNTIHGNLIEITETQLQVIYITILALYLYILDEFECDNKFNLIQRIFG